MTNPNKEGLEARLLRAISRAEDHAGTVPAKEAVKLVPMDWHSVCEWGRKAADALCTLREENEALQRERTILIATKREQLERLTAERVTSQAREKIYREALEPFAEYAPYVEMFVEGRAANGGSPTLPTNFFRLEHFRRARTALQQKD